MDFLDLDTSLKITKANIVLYSGWLQYNRQTLKATNNNERSNFIKFNIGFVDSNPGAVISFIKKTGLANSSLTTSQISTIIADRVINYNEYCLINLSKESLILGGIPYVNALALLSSYIVANPYTKIDLNELRTLNLDLTKVTNDSITNKRTDYFSCILEGTGLFKFVGPQADGILEMATDALPIFEYINSKQLSNCTYKLNSKERFDYFASCKEGVFSCLEDIKPNVWDKYFPHLNKQLKQFIIEPTDNSTMELQRIYYGAPGTGKSNEIKLLTGEGKDGVKFSKDFTFRTTFHPDSDYSSFVGAYKPIWEKDADNGQGKIIYDFRPQTFLKAYLKAWLNPTENVALVIEEINRGNCAQIFGDIFQLLDREDNGLSKYPIEADIDMQGFIKNVFGGKVEEFGKKTISEEDKAAIDEYYSKHYDNAFEKIKNGEILTLPKNLSILATMNTSDQSLFPMDSAFKRRWEWIYQPIVEGKDEQGRPLKWYIQVDDEKGVDWWEFLEAINLEIADLTSAEDKKLGYFFCTPDGDDKIISAKRFVGKVIFYLWNDVFKDYAFDRKCCQDKDSKPVMYAAFYDKGDGKSINTETLKQFFEKLSKDGETLLKNLTDLQANETAVVPAKQENDK